MRAGTLGGEGDKKGILPFSSYAILTSVTRSEELFKMVVKMHSPTPLGI